MRRALIAVSAAVVVTLTPTRNLEAVMCSTYNYCVGACDGAESTCSWRIPSYCEVVSAYCSWAYSCVLDQGGPVGVSCTTQNRP